MDSGPLINKSNRIFRVAPACNSSIGHHKVSPLISVGGTSQAITSDSSLSRQRATRLLPGRHPIFRTDSQNGTSKPQRVRADISRPDKPVVSSCSGTQNPKLRPVTTSRSILIWYAALSVVNCQQAVLLKRSVYCPLPTENRNCPWSLL